MNITIPKTKSSNDLDKTSLKNCRSSYMNVFVFLSAILIDSCTGKSMEKLQDLGQSELQDLLDNSERVASMALESDEVRFYRFQVS